MLSLMSFEPSYISLRCYTTTIHAKMQHVTCIQQTITNKQFNINTALVLETCGVSWARN